MTIGLFAPLPLAIMIPFMAAQSFAMGEAFGKSFQYGKRKISSLTNEQFNKLTAEALHAEVQNDISKMIPHMKKSFDRMEKFQSEVVNSIIRGIAETIGNIGGALNPAKTDVSDVAYYGSTGIPLGQLKASDPYTQWLQTKELLEKQLKDFVNIAPSGTKTPPPKKHKHTLSHHFVKTTTQFQDPRKTKLVGTSQARKLELQNNQKHWEQKLKQATNLKIRVTKLQKVHARNIAGKRKKSNQDLTIAAGFPRELKKIRNNILDLIKKVQNAKTLLRNFR